MRKPGQKGDKKNRVRKEIRKPGQKEKIRKIGIERKMRKPGQKEMRENRFVKNGNEINW